MSVLIGLRSPTIFRGFNPLPDSRIWRSPGPKIGSLLELVFEAYLSSKAVPNLGILFWLMLTGDFDLFYFILEKLVLE